MGSQKVGHDRACTPSSTQTTHTHTHAHTHTNYSSMSYISGGVLFLGWKDPLQEEMATHSSILACRIPWTEEPGGLQSMGSWRVGHDWATDAAERLSMHQLHHCCFYTCFQTYWAWNKDTVILYVHSIIEDTEAQPLVQDAHMWLCMPCMWTNLRDWKRKLTFTSSKFTTCRELTVYYLIFLPNFFFQTWI